MAMSGLSRLQLARVAVVMFSVVDVVTSTLLFVRIGDWDPRDTVSREVKHFNFGVALLDLWLLALLRVTALAIVLVLAFCCNKGKVVQTVRLFSPGCTVLIVLLFCYTVAKLLASFEFYADGSQVHGGVNATLRITNSTGPHRPRHPYHPWLWGMLGWGALALVVYGTVYALVASIPPKSMNPNHRTGGRNSESGIKDSESTPLLSGIATDSSGEAGKSDQGERKTESSAATIKTMCKLVKYSRPDIHLYVLGFSFLVLSSSAMSFIPYYTGQVINHIAISPSMDKFEQAIIVMSVVTVVSAISAGLRGGIMTVANARLVMRIRRVLFQSITRQEIAYFDTAETGDLTSRLTSDTTMMSDQITLNLNVFLRNLVQCVGSVVFMVQLTWKLTVITLVGIPLITVVTWYYGEYFKSLAKAVQDSLAKANNVAEETISSMRTVRSFANEGIEVENYVAKLAVTLRLYYKEAVLYGSWVMANNLLALVLQIVTLYYGGHLVIFHEVTGGELVSFLLYQVSLAAAIDAMGSVVTGLMQAVGAAEKVFELIDRSPAIDHGDGKLCPQKLEGQVEFRDVWFSYPARPNTPILRGVSFTANPGEIVALVGPSGGGKSSCISLLERFYEPNSGSVLLDGKPLSSFDHSYLHTKVSLVGQEPVLYARSIASNIACGMNGVPRETIEEAARLANAHGFISGMGEGYETQAGEKGAQLSGGQKQRIAIARALIRDPTVLLLDEATSALDAESEHLVQQALNRNLDGRTVIVIAHRLSTIETADRIIVINKGKVVEVGSHQQLVQNTSGMYAKLVRKQLVSEAEEASDSQESIESVQTNCYGAVDCFTQS